MLITAADPSRPEPFAPTIPRLKEVAARPEKTTIPCRHCTRQVPADARTCPYCSRDLANPAGGRNQLLEVEQTAPLSSSTVDLRRFLPIVISAASVIAAVALVIHLVFSHRSMVEGVDPALVGGWRASTSGGYLDPRGQMTLDIAPWGTFALSDWGESYHGCMGRIAAANRRWQISEASGRCEKAPTQ